MPRPITAYAVIKKKNPRLNLIDLYETGEVGHDEETEEVIKVKIEEVREINKKK